MTLPQTPPFHSIPVRRGHFNHLALLAQELEQAKLGEQKGEVIARLDGAIREILSKPGKVGTTIIGIMAQQDRTRGKAERLLREVAELIEELAVMEGTVEWVSELGVRIYNSNEIKGSERHRRRQGCGRLGSRRWQPISRKRGVRGDRARLSSRLHLHGWPLQ